MPLRPQLEACVRNVPGCIGASYIDLESGFTLDVVSDPPMDEEARNLLAVAAVQALGSASVRELGNVLAPGPEEIPAFRETIVMSETAIHVFERMENYPNEAICLILRPDADPREFLPRARGCLATLSLAGII